MDRAIQYHFQMDSERRCTSSGQEKASSYWECMFRLVVKFLVPYPFSKQALERQTICDIPPPWHFLFLERFSRSKPFFIILHGAEPDPRRNGHPWPLNRAPPADSIS